MQTRNLHPYLGYLGLLEGLKWRSLEIATQIAWFFFFILDSGLLQNIFDEGLRLILPICHRFFLVRQTTKSTPGRQVVHWRNKVMSFQQFDGGLVVFENLRIAQQFYGAKNSPLFFFRFLPQKKGDPPIFSNATRRVDESHKTGVGKIGGREGEHPQLVGWVCWSHAIGRVFAARDAHPLCRTYSQHWHLGGLLFPRPSDSGGFVKNNHHDSFVKGQIIVGRWWFLLGLHGRKTRT